MGVQVKCVLTENYRDRQFIANDIVLLMKKEKYIWDASKGTLLEQNNNNQQQQKTQHQSRFGIVGHIEYTRKSVDGLTIQVSRELWKECGTSEMVLLKLGCNITSLREFTALCRMDSIPLLDYILGNKMPSSSKQQSLIAQQKKSKDMDDYDMIDPSVEVNFTRSLVKNFFASISLKFFFFFRICNAFWSNPFEITTSKKILLSCTAKLLSTLKLHETIPPKALVGSQASAIWKLFKLFL